jgi:glycosyltransferase involved in cell wall biosynthesis
MRFDVTIVTSGHDIADARLHREVAAFRRAGLTVEVLGLGRPTGAPDGAARVKTWHRGSMLKRGCLAMRLPWLAHGSVLVSLDPDSAVGCYLRRLLVPGSRRVRWVADVHEDYGALIQDRPWARGLLGVLGGLVARAGHWLVRHADLTAVADTHLNTDAPRRLVVRNFADVTMLPAPSDPAPAPKAIYVGDLRASRGLQAMVEAVAGAPEWTADLVGPVQAKDQAWLDERLGGDEALAARLRMPGRLPPVKAWCRATGAWAGFLLLEDTAAFHESMPSKLYEYLALGIPVISTPLPRPVHLIERTGVGVVVKDAAEAAAVMRRWASNPAEYRAVLAAARRAAAEVGKAAGQMDALAAAVAELVDQA